MKKIIKGLTVAILAFVVLGISACASRRERELESKLRSLEVAASSDTTQTRSLEDIIKETAESTEVFISEPNADTSESIITNENIRASSINTYSFLNSPFTIDVNPNYHEEDRDDYYEDMYYFRNLNLDLRLESYSGDIDMMFSSINKSNVQLDLDNAAVSMLESVAGIKGATKVSVGPYMAYILVDIFRDDDDIEAIQSYLVDIGDYYVYAIAKSEEREAAIARRDIEEMISSIGIR